MEGDITCRLCHEECNFGCKGSTNKDCISLDPVLKPWFKDCKTVQYGLEFGRCLSECPSQESQIEFDIEIFSFVNYCRILNFTHYYFIRFSQILKDFIQILKIYKEFSQNF